MLLVYFDETDKLTGRLKLHFGTPAFPFKQIYATNLNLSSIYGKSCTADSNLPQWKYSKKNNVYCNRYRTEAFRHP